MEFHRNVLTGLLFLFIVSPASAKIKDENLRCFQALGKFEFAEGSEHHGKFIAVARVPGGLKEYAWDGRAMSLLVRGKGVQPNLSQPKDIFWSTDELANGDGRVVLKTKGMQLSLNDIAYMQLQLIRESFNRFRESEPDPRRMIAYREMLTACRDVKDMMIDHKTIGTLANEQLQRLEVPVEAGRRRSQPQGTKP
ncbi:MAG: hypothetical protein JNJ49_05730 [Bdellovibrionaceae bacterium]|nr:hypothetical protein [Pseudobdellovibrionaceae bacterium]